MADPTVLAASSTAAWTSLAGWFTPTSLFLLLNIMIGTILISSRFQTAPKPPTDDQHRYYDHNQYGQPGSAPLARAPSLIDRVRSINFSGLYKFDHHPIHPDYHQHHYPEHTTEFATRVDPPHAPVARAPSLLERLKSINFAPYIFDQPNLMPVTAPEPEYIPPQANPAPITHAPSLIQRLKSINLSPYQYIHPNPIPETVKAQAYSSEPSPKARMQPVRAEPPPVAPVPSFLERVKSINFSLYGQDNDHIDFLDNDDRHVKRINSDTTPRGGEAPTKLSRKMKKSASDKSEFGHFESYVDELARVPETGRDHRGAKNGRDQVVPAVVSEEADDHEEINAKADDFINKFKAQLKLQRLESIVKYKEMLSRGAS